MDKTKLLLPVLALGAFVPFMPIHSVPLPIGQESSSSKHLNIPYHSVAGVDKNLLSLDIYTPNRKSKSKPNPVLIMIHGGAWRMGDKSNPSILGAKLQYFLKQNYIYVSINYRLSPNVQHPVHVQDCAKAIAWIHNQIHKYGGDPEQLHLMGHSAGAHLAGLVATNERFLKAEGKSISIIKSNVLLDTAAIDITEYPTKLKNKRILSTMYERAFGRDPAVLRDASPAKHVSSGKSIPPTLLFYGGNRMNLHQTGPKFADALTAIGSPSQAIDTVDLSHRQINTQVGSRGDEMIKLIAQLHQGKNASKFPKILPGKKYQKGSRQFP